MNQTFPSKIHHDVNMIANSQTSQRPNIMVPIQGRQPYYPNQIVSHHQSSPYSIPIQEQVSRDMARCLPNAINGHTMHQRSTNMHHANNAQWNRNEVIMQQNQPQHDLHPLTKQDEYTMPQQNQMQMRGYPPSFASSATHYRSVYPPFYHRPSRFRYPLGNPGIINNNMKPYPQMMNSFNHQNVMGHQIPTQNLQNDIADTNTTLRNNERNMKANNPTSASAIVSNGSIIEKCSTGPIFINSADSNSGYNIESNQISPSNSSEQENEIVSQDITPRSDHTVFQTSQPNVHALDMSKSKMDNENSNPKSTEREVDVANILCSLYNATPQTDDSKNRPQSMFESRKSSSIQDSPSSVSSREFPTRLFTPNDRIELNGVHCFIRKELLELFVVKESPQHHSLIPTVSKDDEESFGQRYTQTVSSLDYQSSVRVGLRCVFCSKHTGRACENTSMRMFYPRKINDLYKMINTFQRVHFARCSFVPLEVKKKYEILKSEDKSRGKKAYWVASAKAIGLVDDDKYGGGLRFLK